MAFGLAGAFDDRGVVLVDVIFLARPRWLSSTFSSLMPRSSKIGRAAGEDGDVLEHGLAAVAEAGGLDGAHLERAAELVDHQRRQGLALDVLGDDQQRLAGLGDLLQQRDQVLGARDLLLVDEDVGFSSTASIVSGW
jgi:hypothetical protein